MKLCDVYHILEQPCIQIKNWVGPNFFTIPGNSVSICAENSFSNTNLIQFPSDFSIRF